MNRFLFLLLFLILLFPSVSFSEDFTLQLHQIKAVDLARIVYGDVLRQSFILDSDVIQSADSVSINWMDLKKSEVDSMTRDLLQLRGFELVRNGNVLLIRKHVKEDDDFFIYQPRNRSARYLSDIVAKVADANQLGSRVMDASPDFKSSVSKQPEVVGSVGSVIDQSAKDQLAYQCDPLNCVRLKKLLADLDTPEAQIILRAAIYEVGTSQGKGSAIQIAASLLDGRASVKIGNLTPGNAQLNILAGGLDAAIAVLDQDARFKVVSRPMLRVRTGAQGKFSVGQSVPVLGAVSLDRNGNQIQSVEYKQSGTIFTVQPDVRLDVIDLSVTQELSNFVATTTGVNNSPTLLQRTASSQLSIKSGEVVVFAGLEDQRVDEANSKLWGFDLGSKSSSSTSEVLVFIEAQRI